MSSAAAATFTLSRFVEDIRVLDGRRGHVERLPDGRTALCVRVLEGGKGDLTVLGPRTRAMFKQTTGVVHAVLFQLKPGWSAPLLGVSTRAFTDRIVPLADVWGRTAVDLCDDLVAARSFPQILTTLGDAIGARSAQIFESASALLARRAVRLLEGGEVRVNRVASELGVTGRHLRRAFTDSIGIGPKDFARTVRLQRAVRMSATSRDWGRIATEAGYYDQAHLIGEFRELVGLTPGAFARRPSGVRLPVE